MSDFTSDFWSWWITAIVVGGIVWCIWLLIVNSKGKLPTGGTAEAGIKLIERLGGDIVGCSFIVDLPELGGRKKLELRHCFGTFLLILLCVLLK